MYVRLPEFREDPKQEKTLYLNYNKKMSAAVKSIFTGAMKLVTPAFYKGQYAQIVASVHKDIRKGSIRPLFQAVAIVGITGYTMEYALKGRYAPEVLHSCSVLCLLTPCFSFFSFLLLTNWCFLSFSFLFYHTIDTTLWTDRRLSRRQWRAMLIRIGTLGDFCGNIKIFSFQFLLHYSLQFHNNNIQYTLYLIWLLRL